MASYSDMRLLFNDGVLIGKVEVAVIIAAETIRVEDGGTTNHANRLVWAKQVFISPYQKAREVLTALLAGSVALEVSAIVNASDAVIQSKVDAVVDIFANGS